MASMRASETREQTVKRQEQNRTHMANMRASETCEQILQRKQQDRVHKASMRASDSPSEMIQRKESTKERMSNRRRKSVSVEHAISIFNSEVRFGAYFVCTCCHQMMYQKSVVPCNKVKYTKAGTDVLQMVFSDSLCYISSDGKEYMCKTCDRTLKRGALPLQAKANGL